MLDSTDRKIINALQIITDKSLEDIINQYESNYDLIEEIIIKKWEEQK